MGGTQSILMVGQVVRYFGITSHFGLHQDGYPFHDVPIPRYEPMGLRFHFLPGGIKSFGQMRGDFTLLKKRPQSP